MCEGISGAGGGAPSGGADASFLPPGGGFSDNPLSSKNFDDDGYEGDANPSSASSAPPPTDSNWTKA